MIRSFTVEMETNPEGDDWYAVLRVTDEAAEVVGYTTQEPLHAAAALLDAMDATRANLAAAFGETEAARETFGRPTLIP